MAPPKKATTTSNKGSNVFIAWAGARSKAVAKGLTSWLPTMIDAVEPWMSEESLRTGQNWFSEIMQRLSSVKIGILCLTPENLTAEWIHFEAGAIANRVSENARVMPYLIGVSSDQVKPPLSVLHHRKATEEPTLSLINDINEATGMTVESTILKKKFDKFWPDLRAIIDGAAPEIAPPNKGRSTDDMVKEILDLVRGLRLDVAPPTSHGPLEAMFGRGRILDRAHDDRMTDALIRIRDARRPITDEDLALVGVAAAQYLAERAGADDNAKKKK